MTAPTEAEMNGWPGREQDMLAWAARAPLEELRVAQDYNLNSTVLAAIMARVN